MVKGRPWTREELIVAYALYCVIPFSKLNNSNRTIKDAAEIIGRSPAALKMKICNLAALDPDFLATGRVGLWGGISKLDREIYEEFSKDWEGLSTKAESIVHKDCILAGADNQLTAFLDFSVGPFPEDYIISVLFPFNYVGKLPFE